MNLYNYIKNLVRFCGYEIHKLGSCTDPNTLSIDRQGSYPRIVKYNIGDISFDFWIINESVENDYNPNAIYNDTEIKEIINLIKPGERILEVGSNIGFFTLLLAKLAGNSGYVLGIEPLQKNTLVAHAQIALNNMSNTCQIKDCAISDKKGITYVTRMSHNASVQITDKRNTIATNAFTGDSFLDSFGPFSAIKIDVEGYEASVLRGCKRILASKPKLLIELHVPFLHKYNTNVEEIFRLIEIENYEGIMIFRKNKLKSFTFDPSLIENDVINLLLKPKPTTGIEPATSSLPRTCSTN